METGVVKETRDEKSARQKGLITNPKGADEDATWMTAVREVAYSAPDLPDDWVREVKNGRIYYRCAYVCVCVCVCMYMHTQACMYACISMGMKVW